MLRAGIPDITGSFGSPTYESSSYFADGAFTISSRTSSGRASGGGGGFISWEFKASASNTLYGSSETIQPPALSLIPQFKY